MATINTKSVIDNLIKNNGFCEDDPQVHMIVEYTNAYGGICWGVTWINEHADARIRYLDETEYVKNPRVIWHHEEVKMKG